jgi:hypothetical protein
MPPLPGPTRETGSWLNCCSSPFCLRPPQIAEQPSWNPVSENVNGARFTTFEVPHRIQSPPRHHVLATGIAALRAGGSSPACFPRPDPRLRRRPGRVRAGAASGRSLRPRRHQCHCSGTPAPRWPNWAEMMRSNGGIVLGRKGALWAVNCPGCGPMEEASNGKPKHTANLRHFALAR